MRAFKISEEKYLRENYGKVSLAAMAKHLGRGKSTIYQHIRKMGLQLPDDIKRERMKASQFKPGSIPKNKGTKGFMKPNRTSFKPGHTPHNTKHDEAISIRQKKGDKPYKFVRLASSKWVLLHRYQWEQVNGPIPAGHVLRCIDGDTLNAEPSNWQPISRAENAAKNHNRKKQAETMRTKWERVRRLESLGVVPASTKLRTKRKQKETPKVPIIVSRQDISNLPEHNSFL